MKVIVFGGTGWVGHHVVLSFLDAGYEVTICSRGQRTTYLEEIPDGIPMVQADKDSASDVAGVFQKTYDVVIDSVPTEASIDNVVKHARCLKQYIHCSSTGGYAPLPFIPGDETMPYDEFMGGWRHKGIVDAKVMDLSCREGFPATVIRPCYITGPGMLPLDNMGGRRESFITDILSEVPLDSPNDGQALLQPIHVCDLAHSFLLAAQQSRSIGQIYNICLEKAVTLTRYLEINAAALDREVTVNYIGLEAMLEKYGDSISELGLRFLATHMCYDTSKACEQLGYIPQYSTEEAIEETARWTAEQLADDKA